MNSQHKQMLIMMLVIFIGFIGVALPYPIFPPLFLHPEHGTIIPEAWGQHNRSLFLGVTLAMYPLGQFLGSPILGALSDRLGRKKILMLSLAGTVIGYLFSAVSLQTDHLGLLIFSRFLTGLMEGNIAIARAMAIDLGHDDKHKSLGRVNAIAALGYIVGPLIGGFLADPGIVSWFSFYIPFYAAAVMALVTIILIATSLQETAKLQPSKALSLWKQFNIIKRFSVLCQDKRLRALLIVSSVFTLAVDIFYEFGPVYLAGQWQMMPAMIALYNVALCIGLIIGNGYLAFWFNRRFNSRNITVCFGLLTALLLVLMVLFVNKLWVFIAFGFMGLTMSISVTSLTVQISNVAADDIQGEVMGTQLSFRMFGDSIICLLGGVFILVTVKLPLLLGATLAILAILLYRKNPEY